ncbi:MAG: MFS transporter [Candidatus Cloacimonadaceae bacterium]
MKLNRNIVGWMFYDFANSSFTTIIVTVVYSAYFIKQVVNGAPGYGEMLWGRAVALSMTLVAISAPIFGAVADYSRSKKKFLFINCYLTVIFTALLYFVGKGDVTLGIVFFVIANFGFNSANVFYDAFLPEITSRETMGRISGYGWAFGYAGGLLALLISLPLVKTDIRLVFPMVAVFFFLFSLVTAFWLKEFHRPSQRTNYLKTALYRISYSFNHIRKIPELLKYLLSYFIYNDGITTVIVFASVYGITRFGMTTQNMITYFIIAQITSILGAAVFGYWTDKIGVKPTLNISLFIWLAVVIWAFFCRSAEEYYFVGMLAGLAIGSSQANSRTLLAMLTPQNKRAEFFGFYTLTGRLSSIIGPLVYGEIARRTGSPRWAILSLIVFFALGLILLQTVNVKKGIQESLSLSANAEGGSNV